MLKTLEQNMLNKYFSKPETLFTVSVSFENSCTFMKKSHIKTQLHKQLMTTQPKLNNKL